MCKHVYIAHVGIRFAKLVICMGLHTDRIQKNNPFLLFRVMQFNQL